MNKRPSERIKEIVLSKNYYYLANESAAMRMERETKNILNAVVDFLDESWESEQLKDGTLVDENGKPIISLGL